MSMAAHKTLSCTAQSPVELGCVVFQGLPWHSWQAKLLLILGRGEELCTPLLLPPARARCKTQRNKLCAACMQYSTTCRTTVRPDSHGTDFKRAKMRHGNINAMREDLGNVAHNNTLTLRSDGEACTCSPVLFISAWYF